MNIKMFKYLAVWLLLIVFTVGMHAEGKKDDKKSLAKTNALPTPQTGKFNINNISTWLYADGRSDINNGNSGFEYPKGGNKQIFYQSGFIWGGKVQLSGGGEEIRVTGTAYRTSMTPGHVVGGAAVDPNTEPRARVFRVRPDYATADLTSEVNDGEGTEAQIRAQYAKDWQEWPDELGAPYTDVNGNGVYDPAEDIAGFPGADQTLWYVNNDFDPDQAAFPYGSGPMGVEVQTTVWGYNRPGALGSVMFRKYTMINKSGKDIKDMYVSMWSDPDCGDATDDLAGIDKEASLMFIYNGKANDATYGYTPPAGGFDFFQGPVVDSPGDTAIFKGAKVANKKNLPATGFYYFINQNEVYNDPEQGDYQEGTLEFWNLFQGKIGTSGDFYPVPGGGVTNFPLDGDPLNNTGYIDGKLFPPGDRRLGMASGPFLFAANDTQEVVVAQLAAGAFGAVDRLGALGLLKFYDLEAQNAYDNFFDIPSAPPAPVVRVTESNESVTLTWGDAASASVTESFNEKGYVFQGYNVYQLPSLSANKSDAKRIATYDINDGIGKIIGDDFNVELGSVLPTILQFGSDVGLKRYITVNTDAFNSNLPLNNGSRYFYAVTAYAYNPDPEVVPQVLENSLSPVAVTPQNANPGNQGSPIGSGYPTVHAGNGNAVVNINVVEPAKLTGDEYQVFFTQKSLYRAEGGVWKEQGTDILAPARKDLAGADLDVVIVHGLADKTFDITMVPYGWDSDSEVDAMKVQFPAGTIVNSGSEDIVLPVIDSVNATIQWGKNDTSQAGPIHNGASVLTVNVGNVTFPLQFTYTLYDDGADTTVPILNFTGNKSFPFDTVTFVQKTEYYWNLKNVTKNTTPITNQSVYAGVEWYSGDNRDVRLTVGDYTAPVVDGFQISMSDLTYAAPSTYTTAEQTVKAVSTTPELALLGDYVQYFGSGDGRAYNLYNGGATATTEDLFQDIEFRFTGVADPSAADPNDAPIVSGGQMATLWNRTRSQNAIVRIPFEVWEKERNRQINVAVVFRNVLATDPWGDSGVPTHFRFYSRPYIVPVATPYDEAFTTPIAPNNGQATWVYLFNYGEAADIHWDRGDVFEFQYPNLIVPGEDAYTFSTVKSSYSVEKAKNDVNEINVFPNPYYGVNPQELNKYQKFVTFSHLPAGRVTIRIFNLAGQLVNTIEKNSTDQFERWSLDNDAGLPVASGLYIVHIDMPELGKTKILKLAIIQEQQILDRF
jgi:hypothetical protein